MERWSAVAVAFVVGAALGFLYASHDGAERGFAELAGRVSALEEGAAGRDAGARIDALTERVATLEGRVEATAQRAQAPGRGRGEAVGRAQEVALGNAPVRGPDDAPVTIVEFSDFQCPFCTRVHPTLLRLLEDYPQSVRLAFKHFPLDFHQDAPLAHRASIAAGNQGRFWEMHDRIFANGRDLSRETLMSHARALGLDMSRFVTDLDAEATGQRMRADIAEGNRLGITGTPTFYINGRVVAGAQPYENFRALVERELALAGS